MNGTQHPAVKREATSGARILAVDDDPISHEVLAAHLAREGYELVSADNGAQALLLASQVQPDTILLDVMMPGIDGFETCRRLKNDANLAHIPVILLTALDDRRYVAEGLNAGADEFITKPVVGDELRARVRSMLRIKRQHDELRRLMRLREDLVQMAVHDIRSPLNAVMTYGELLTQSGPLSATQAADLAELLRGAARIENLVDDVLTLAKMEGGSISLRRRDVNLSALVSTVVDMHRGTLARSKIELCLELPEAPLPVWLDENLVHRVLDNLLSNAIKFSPSGSLVAVGLYPGRQSVTLRVSDQGVGVPGEHRRRIFDKFGIVELRQQNLPQFGLGLAFCKVAIEAHGGRIVVIDNEPRGAVFEVELPLGTASA